jgi:hypothetical protein
MCQVPRRLPPQAGERVGQAPFVTEASEISTCVPPDPPLAIEPPDAFIVEPPAAPELPPPLAPPADEPSWLALPPPQPGAAMSRDDSITRIERLNGHPEEG